MRNCARHSLGGFSSLLGSDLFGVALGLCRLQHIPSPGEVLPEKDSPCGSWTQDPRHVRVTRVVAQTGEAGVIVVSIVIEDPSPCAPGCQYRRPSSPGPPQSVSTIT